METINAIARRCSVRAYNGEQLSAEELNTVLRAGCAAPVGLALYDSMMMTVVQDKTLLDIISKGIQQGMNRPGDPVYGAPTLIILSSKAQPAVGIDYANAGCIMENMMLAATELGLGSVIIWGAGTVAETVPGLKALLEIPAEYHALAGLALGKTDVLPAEKTLDLKIPVCYK